MTEVWKDIEGYEGIYQVSNLGRVRSLDREFVTKAGFAQSTKGCFIKPFTTRNGYLSVRLRTLISRKTYFVHRLVAQTFIPNPDCLPIINHRDENKQNNRVDNLEWCTQEYNVNYGSSLSKLSASHRNHPCLSKEVRQLLLTGELLHVYPSAKEAARQAGLSDSNIVRCCNAPSKTAGGYRWEYSES